MSRLALTSSNSGNLASENAQERFAEANAVEIIFVNDVGRTSRDQFEPSLLCHLSTDHHDRRFVSGAAQKRNGVVGAIGGLQNIVEKDKLRSLEQDAIDGGPQRGGMAYFHIVAEHDPQRGADARSIRRIVVNDENIRQDRDGLAKFRDVAFPGEEIPTGSTATHAYDLCRVSRMLGIARTACNKHGDRPGGKSAGPRACRKLRPFIAAPPGLLQISLNDPSRIRGRRASER